MTEGAQKTDLVPARVKSAARVAGFAVTLAALAFVGVTVYHSFDSLRQELASPLFLLTLVGSAVAYAIVLQLVGLAWLRLLIAVDGPSLSVRQALTIYGKTQIYKYLPTNVLHMVGRYALARKSRVSNQALVFAQIGELLTTVLAASALAIVLARPLLIRSLSRQGLAGDALANIWIAGGFVALVVGIALFVRFRRAEAGRRALRALATAFVFYTLFFIGSGFLVAALCRSLDVDGSSALGELIGIGAAAWLVGFVVPGAPGGFGVREAVLITGLLAAGLAIPVATAVALGYRLVTVAGDAVVAVTASLIEFKG